MHLQPNHQKNYTIMLAILPILPKTTKIFSFFLDFFFPAPPSPLAAQPTSKDQQRLKPKLHWFFAPQSCCHSIQQHHFYH